MGKDDSEDYETSSRNIKISPFWMAKYEITWDIFNLFLSREIDSLQVRKSYKNELNVDVDAVSGATAPYVDMSFGMGVEGYPAISMTQLTASKFCDLEITIGYQLKLNGSSASLIVYIILEIQLIHYQSMRQKVGQKLSNKFGLLMEMFLSGHLISQ